MEIRVSFDEVLNWKKAFRFILFSIFISLKINAQYTGEQFGEIDEETIKSRVSEIDSSFDAEILFEERKYGPINSIDAKEFEEFVFKRLKIYRPSGYKHANFVVKYFDPNRWDRQEIEDLKVSVYNWTNNSIVKSKINSSDFVIEDIS